jgi:pimeloyl-ACP methyl ester carboxylesterase
MLAGHNRSVVASGTPVVRELGLGHPILVVHGGMSDEAPWLRVAESMAGRYRIVLVRRRLYRLELTVPVEQAMAEQVSEVLDIAQRLGQPCVIVGHSSGAIVALEAMAADPVAFAGGILYEPPSPLDDLPLGKATTLPQARAALAAGHVGRALQIFLREGVEVSPLVGAAAPAMALLPEVRRYVPRQIDDFASILHLGVRSDTYRHIEQPLWFLTGARSPAHLQRRCQQLTSLLPRADLVELPGVGHGANQSHPRQLGSLLCDLADLLRTDEPRGT